MSCPITADISPNCSQVLLIIYYTFVIITSITSITGVNQVTASVSVSECRARGVFSSVLRDIPSKA